jgi:hypothetical protein
MLDFAGRKYVVKKIDRSTWTNTGTSGIAFQKLGTIIA